MMIDGEENGKELQLVTDSTHCGLELACILVTALLPSWV